LFQALLEMMLSSGLVIVKVRMRNAREIFIVFFCQWW